MITICVNHEVNREILVEALIDAGLPESKARRLHDTRKHRIWTDVFDSVNDSPLGTDYRISGRYESWNDGRYTTSGWREGIVHSDLCQKEADKAAAVLAALLASVCKTWL